MYIFKVNICILLKNINIIWLKNNYKEGNIECVNQNVILWLNQQICG